MPLHNRSGICIKMFVFGMYVLPRRKRRGLCFLLGQHL